MKFKKKFNNDENHNMNTFNSDVTALNDTFKRIDKSSIELSRGLRDTNLVENKVNLIEETATAKAQIETIRAKNDMLGSLMDLIG